MKYWLNYILFCLLPLFVSAQKESSRFADITGAFGSSQAVIYGAYVHAWKLGTSKKWEVGLGLRASSYFGVKKDFLTAPSRLSRASSVPFLVYFSKKQIQNIDTLTVQRPFTNSINISANAGYSIRRWYIGFSVDLIGYTFGRTTSGILKSDGYTRTEANAKPAPFNLLLTGDNNYGTLNTEIFLRYKLSKDFSVKGTYQALAVEYKTSAITQNTPDGSTVNRFRNKTGNAGFGVVYHFK
jgi:hypothetical protein